MHRKIERLVLFALLAGLMAVLAPQAGAATDHLSGVGVFDTTGACTEPPAGYEDFTMVMTGSLEGCWYTKIISATDNGIPSGVYQERGEEVFVGSLDAGPVGTFATTYKFTSKWDPDVSTGSESEDAASTRSLRAAVRAASKVPPVGSTSRTTSSQGSTSIGATSAFADTLLPNGVL